MNDTKIGSGSHDASVNYDFSNLAIFDEGNTPHTNSVACRRLLSVDPIVQEEVKLTVPLTGRVSHTKRQGTTQFGSSTAEGLHLEPQLANSAQSEPLSAKDIINKMKPKEFYDLMSEMDKHCTANPTLTMNFFVYKDTKIQFMNGGRWDGEAELSPEEHIYWCQKAVQMYKEEFQDSVDSTAKMNLLYDSLGRIAVYLREIKEPQEEIEKLQEQLLPSLVEKRWKERASDFSWLSALCTNNLQKVIEEAAKLEPYDIDAGSPRQVLCVQEDHKGPSKNFAFREWKDLTAFVEVQNKKVWRRLTKTELLIIITKKYKFWVSDDADMFFETMEKEFIQAIGFFKSTIALYPAEPGAQLKDEDIDRNTKASFEEHIKNVLSKEYQFMDEEEPGSLPKFNARGPEPTSIPRRGEPDLFSKPSTNAKVAKKQIQLRNEIKEPLTQVLGCVWKGLFEDEFKLSADNVDKICKRLKVEYLEKGFLTFDVYKKIHNAFALISAPDKVKDLKLNECFSLIGPYHTQMKNAWQPKEWAM